ncbi:hypothetical protein B0H14DRAFT_2907125 [Mycena olivaceomarginata]|nr:hypothetical protein B0H14DRAFT_2907125 [Mycena olivaceomarginata]
MRLCASLLLSLAATLLARAQADGVSVNGLSSVSRPTDPALSVNGLSFVPVPTLPLSLSWGLTYIPVPTDSSSSSSSASGSTKSNKGKIAGGVVAGLAVLLALLLTTAFLIRRRSKASTTHWRNRIGGWTWQRDAEGAAPPHSPGAGAAKFAPTTIGKREPGAMGPGPQAAHQPAARGVRLLAGHQGTRGVACAAALRARARIGRQLDAVPGPGHKRQGSSGSN